MTRIIVLQHARAAAGIMEQTTLVYSLVTNLLDSGWTLTQFPCHQNPFTKPEEAVFVWKTDVITTLCTTPDLLRAKKPFLKVYKLSNNLYRVQEAHTVMLDLPATIP
uniref:AlNc14C63G4552 protein n=1 Tax=Albugo laibachii Nc14 TaxID=890382 RepID=F0WD31_9STRA|nr:AlNc14C63G4552 [Albugo laibachii Nc14]|eukprot:CCA19103.1 AlNc14C63G4552 [Albugo laibachii Nc14]